MGSWRIKNKPSHQITGDITFPNIFVHETSPCFEHKWRHISVYCQENDEKICSIAAAEDLHDLMPDLKNCEELPVILAVAFSKAQVTDDTC